MPIEFLFDDLDLREEPQSAKSTDADSSAICTQTAYCTQTCGTSYDTCTY